MLVVRLFVVVFDEFFRFFQELSPFPLMPFHAIYKNVYNFHDKRRNIYLKGMETFLCY